MRNTGCKGLWWQRILLLLFTIHCSLFTSFAQTGQRTYDYYFLEAMVQRQKGNNDAAFDLLRHCLEINPDASEAHYYIAQYYAGLKNDSLSMAHIQRAAELSPGNETFLETLAQLYIRQQKYGDAIAVVEQIYNRDKSREDLLEMLFQLYQQENDYKHAIGVLERMENIDGKSERLSMAKSEIYTRMGDKKAAIAEVEALAKQYPNDLNYLAMYGDMLMMNGQEKKALKTFNSILAEEPDNSRVLMSLRNYYLGKPDHAMADSLTTRILLNRSTSQEDKIYLIRQEIQASENADGDSTRVLSLFRRMNALQPNADMYILQATYMNLKQMPKDSINPVLQQVLDIAPDNAAARLQLVSNAWSADDMDGVVTLCQGGRQYNPDEMAFYYYQGIAYYKQERLDEALSAFQNGIGVINDESNPAIVSDFYAVMGDILHQKGQAEAAYAAYDSCLVWKDDNIGCLNNYAYYLSEEGEQLDKAEQMSYKTIKAEPKNATYLDTYAWILFMQQRYSEARIYIDQALQNKDDSLDNAVILEHAGDIYACCDDSEKALAYWQDALKGAPDKEVLIRKIKLKKYVKE
ncbi:MAG: tetratricopeptide repeat protein [Prevotella sp.]|nr:tetratricopeptide repeat protein [Prevotella sp.]